MSMLVGETFWRAHERLRMTLVGVHIPDFMK